MKNMSFEKALENLETIIEELESGDFSLDDSLKKYEEAIKLVRACREKLEKARKKIDVLTKKDGGDFETKPFEEE